MVQINIPNFITITLITLVGGAIVHAAAGLIFKPANGGKGGRGKGGRGKD